MTQAVKYKDQNRSNHQKNSDKDVKRDQTAGQVVYEDEFLSIGDLHSLNKKFAKQRTQEIISDISESIREKKWENVLTMYYPVEEKCPEISGSQDLFQIKQKLGFVLGQIQKFDDAIRELTYCVTLQPDNFLVQSSLAYSAYNSLYAAKNRQIFLSGVNRKERIDLAHDHFEKAQILRPDGVTNFYRQAMLYKQIENKNAKAVVLFKRAISNWKGLDNDQRQMRHQERKNYIKSLYQYASCLLDLGHGPESLESINQCLSEDEKTNHVDLIFKYFALGKVNFHLGRYEPAIDALLFADKCKSDKTKDYVYELLARTYLALNNPEKALETINKIPEKFRKPYVRWTESDIWMAFKKYESARSVLVKSLERDNLSRHKTLIRLAKIEYLLGQFKQSYQYAHDAERFFSGKWNNELPDGLFWRALSVYRLGDLKKAGELARQLKDIAPFYEKVDLLIEKIKMPD